MVNYQNGKIYKLLLPDGFYYIGCTCNELKVRKQQHKNKCNNGDNSNIYKHVRDNNMEWKDIDMAVYEEYPCEIKSQLLLRESQIIRLFCKDEFCLNVLVNTRIDGSAQEHAKQCDINYKNNNRTKISNRMKIYNVENAESIKDKMKIYYVENAESIKEYKKKIIVCECGVQTTINSIHRHKKTKKHLKLLELN